MAEKATSEILSVAAILRSARKKKKLKIAEVSEDICVRSCFLEALETRRFDELPEMTFALGFVKAYAKALGLDQGAVAKQFKQEFRTARAESAHTDAQITDATTPCATQVKTDKNYPIKAGSKRGWPAWLSPVVGLVGAGLSWMWLGAGTATLSTIAAVDEATEARVLAAFAEIDTQAPAEQQSQQSSEPSVEAPAPQGATDFSASGSLFSPAAYASAPTPAGEATSSIVLEAAEDSWIQLSYSDGTELWSGVLRAGQTYQPELIGDVYLTTSNAGGILLRRYDQTHGPLGARGDVVDRLALKPAVFSAGDAVSVVSAGSPGE